MNLLNRKLEKEDYLLYSIDGFSSSSGIRGRKKLMKLMFFLEHLNLEENELTPDRQYSKNEFIIYDYGPFSFDVMNGMEGLKTDGKISEEIRTKPYIINLTEKGRRRSEKIGEKISNDKIQRIQRIKEKFGNEPGWKLEQLSLEYLGIDEEEKTLRKGIPVRVLISEKYD